jgi:hypothetical protein
MKDREIYDFKALKINELKNLNKAFLFFNVKYIAKNYNKISFISYLSSPIFYLSSFIFYLKICKPQNAFRS